MIAFTRSWPSFLACFAGWLAVASGLEAASWSRSRWPSAAEVMTKMGRGINLGNVYDYDSGNDASFESSSRMLDLFAAKGFQNVRIPVTWGADVDFDSERVRLVVKVVEYALDRGFYVIVNTHHERWLKDDYNDTAYYNDQFAALWQGIASLFATTGDQLVFEILNEPDGVLGGWLPGSADPFATSSIELTRAVNEVGYWAVRNVTQDRIILLMPNGMGSQSLARFVYPDRSFLPQAGADERVAVSVHTYDPWGFCGEHGNNTFFPSVGHMKHHMRKVYSALADWQYSADIPLHVGEYGVGRDDDGEEMRDSDIVREYYRYLPNTFALHGWASTVWADRGWFAIARNYSFVYDLASSILSPY